MTTGLLALTPGSVLVELGRSAREALAMFLETVWALVLGLSISGLVQSFVSREGIERRLGDRRGRALASAAFYGAASSSCSYAAASMARALVRRGADFVTAMVFMFASTNLVIELGIVIAVLLGWQFVAAQFLGGVIMIVVLALFGAAAFTATALRHLGAEGGRDHDGAADEAGAARSLRAGLVDAAGYLVADLTMLRRELLIGFAAAGALATVVPESFWRIAFVHGHGAWTSLENALVGPLVAIVSCVCSIGNVPLAAALWRGGVSFGGVIAFLFADLLALPLLLVYRRLYGTALAARMLVVFWVTISLAGLLTGELFSALGLVPTTRPPVLAPRAFTLGATTVLDAVFLLVLVAAYLAHRFRDRLGASARHARDPVCHMQVEVAQAPARVRRDGETFYFCSESCRDRFLAEGRGGTGAPSEAARARSRAASLRGRVD